jgi:GTP-binding protein
MFYDHAKLEVRAGKGGNGCISFRREKHVPKGGPDGGDGGDGGDVIFVASLRLRDLAYFQRQRHIRAGNGQAGQGSDKNGKRGQDAVVDVPVGTQLYDELGTLLADLTADGQRYAVARGGLGGRGNARFVSSTRRAPRFADLGLAGDELTVRLELKLLADAGLLGFPNAGKSSLLRRISHAKPKVADYPFTTVAPMLGTVEEPESRNQFTVADLPGLLEGAHQGVGLGDQFLAHLERTRLLIHVLDVSGYYGREPVDNFIAINAELEGYGAGLSHKWQLIALNKTDLVSEERVREVADALAETIGGMPGAESSPFSWLTNGGEVLAEEADFSEAIIPISTATGDGVYNLVRKAYSLLQVAWSEQPLLEAPVSGGHTLYRPSPQDYWEVLEEDGRYRVTGPAAEKLVARTDFSNEEAVSFLQEKLERMGVSEALRQAGAAPGEDVVIGEVEFEFW